MQDALDLEEGQEEAWVIRAIGAKLLEARIDQMRRSVTVTKLTQRAFTAAHWADLRAQLAAWKVCRCRDFSPAPMRVVGKHGGPCKGS